jgi:20S proteasome alpha/beta subunit
METKENIKLKNILKKVLENKEFEYSFKETSWDGVVTSKYNFEYHMIVNYVRGVGSGSVADIMVIIDDIIFNGDSMYHEWVERNYSGSVWYIDYLHDHLNKEFFNVFPFSIYPTFYGYDEER